MLRDIKSTIANRFREAAAQSVDQITFEPARRAQSKRARAEAESLDFKPSDPPQPSPSFPPPKLRGIRAASDALTFQLLAAGQYGAVIRALRTVNPTPSQLNNLGCAWAALASTIDRPDYWERAIDALEQSRDTAQTKSERQRAADNIDLVTRIR